MTNDNRKAEKKLEYKKPELKTVELAAKEVLAVGCKISGGGINTGTSPCDVGTCAVASSS